jgi:predicted metalloprotease with PDZ domain
MMVRSLVCALALGSAAVYAEVPAPQDRDYTPGTLQIHVDATDLAHRVFRVRETIPVRSGPLTLLYPQWLPGVHGPAGPIDKLAGLVITAGGRTLPWTRDALQPHAFHLDVPQGAASIEVQFQFLSPQNRAQGRVVMTPEMLNLQWNTVSLYPAGYYANRIQAQASATYPAGWQAASAMEIASTDGHTITYEPIDYDDLVDSPVFAGKYFKRIDLASGASPPVYMDVVADEATLLEIKPEQLKPYQELVRQMTQLYGAHHYDHYDFLFALSDKMSGIGLEHHRSSEDGVAADYFTEPEKNLTSTGLLPHEYNHSWDGKYRRGADLATPSFNVPMRDSLLWVYEGQTRFWDHVLPARIGLWNAEQTNDMMALMAADMTKGRPGLNTWRSVQDTTNDPVMNEAGGSLYQSYQARFDYYPAAAMIWLDVDGKLREQSRGKHSIDDFCKAFFGVGDGKYNVNPYTFEDIVKTLNGVVPYDWATYLRRRLDGHDVLNGALEAHGWKLVYNDQPSVAVKSMEAGRKVVNLTYSLGFMIGKEGEIGDVLWDGPAFKAGLAPGMKLIAVNGKEYSADTVKNAVKDKGPIELLVKNFDEYRTLAVDYHDGLKYPHLERVPGTADTLGLLMAPRSK